MYRFWRFGLKLPIHALFGEVLGAYFPHMTSSITVTPKKDRSWAETRHLSHSV